MQKLDKSKLVRNLGKKQKLAPYLDKAFADFDDPWEFKHEAKVPDTAWHPSGDCTPSPFTLWLKAQNYLDDEGEPALLSGSLRKSFMVGHYWHQLLQYIVLNKLEFCTPDAIERKGHKNWGGDPLSSNALDAFPPFHYVNGSADICPLVLPRGWEGLVDFKTMNARSFKATEIPFADKYECQMNIYMDLFDQDHALILGVNKDSPHDFKEFLWERNQPLINTIMEKWEYTSSYIVRAEPPPKEDPFELPLAGPVIT